MNVFKGFVSCNVFLVFFLCFLFQMAERQWFFPKSTKRCYIITKQENLRMKGSNYTDQEGWPVLLEINKNQHLLNYEHTIYILKENIFFNKWFTKLIFYLFIFHNFHLISRTSKYPDNYRRNRNSGLSISLMCLILILKDKTVTW